METRLYSCKHQNETIPDIQHRLTSELFHLEHNKAGCLQEASPCSPVESSRKVQWCREKMIINDCTGSEWCPQKQKHQPNRIPHRQTLPKQIIF